MVNEREKKTTFLAELWYEKKRVFEEAFDEWKSNEILEKFKANVSRKIFPLISNHQTISFKLNLSNFYAILL